MRDDDDGWEAPELERGELSDNVTDLEFIPITFALDSLDEAIDELVTAIETDEIHYPE